MIDSQNATTELGALRNRKNALETANEYLKIALEDDMRKMEEKIKGKQADLQFPSCSKMDDNYSDEREVENLHDLKDFSEGIRQRMAKDGGLFYSAETVRIFIAGLAMSKLHLYRV